MSPPFSTRDGASRELDLFACPLDGLRLIEASAGTGKTWNICGLYLRLLLERDLAVQQLLVVTFTNAAAAELRSRIRSRIVDVLGYLRRATLAADPFVARLVSAVDHNAGVKREAMLERLDAALQTFDEAAVFTIHGFCQRALSDTPFAAGLPFSLELLQDDGPLRLEAVSDFWRRHVAGQQVAPALADHLAQRGDSPQSWAALLKRQMAKPRARLIWPDELARPTALATHALNAAFVRARAIWNDDDGGPAATLLNALGALNATSYKEESVLAGARTWHEWLARGQALAAPAEDAVNKARLFTVSVLRDKTKKKQQTPTHAFFVAADEFLAQHAALSRELELARLGLLRGLFEEAGAALRAKKRRLRVLSFDDMLYNVDAAIASGDTPWLAGALRDRYPVALIDEFQDTDPLQYAIFNAIYGAQADRPAAPLFLVGDPKQAIYSFRNADLHTYLAARRQAGTPYTLRHNQRSTPPLIDACNALFGRNRQAFILAGLHYEAVSAGDKPRPVWRDQSEANAGTGGGALRIWRLPDADGQYLLRREAMAQVLQATAGEVARLLRAARASRITIGGRALAPGDIAILVKSHAQGRALRRALSALGVGSVELSQQSIFRSAQAEDLERVLLAILEPARPPLLYRALASELMGFDALALARMAADETLLLPAMSRFAGYRESWLRRGFSVMLRAWIDGESVVLRLLAHSDGERRLTNLLHLGELLQQASIEQAAPEALLRWFASRRADDGSDEVAQLRLESDRNLVQIVTIHKAKGLEYGVTFCPFLWDGHQSNFGESEGNEYHDAAGQPVIDFRSEIDAAQSEEIKRQKRAEKDAETMRLMYVALTRAVHRCYLVAGCYAAPTSGGPSLLQGNRSLLNWLVAGSPLSHAEWRAHRQPASSIEAAWRDMVHHADGAATLCDLPATAGKRLADSGLGADALAALNPPTKIASGWRIGSFSSLQHGAESEAAASDHDGRAAPPLDDPASAAGRGLAANLPPDDIVYFPRGPAAGDCVHALFERIDFTAPASWPSAIETALAAFPQALPGLPPGESAKRLARMLSRLLDAVLQTQLPEAIVLAQLERSQRLVELAFHLPASAITAQGLNGWLAAHGYALPKLAFAPLTGYLKGFIDLVFCHAGRYYVLDWKSNHLGDRAADYGREPMAMAMSEHGYHLQCLLYCVAVHRYLQSRIADYDYQRHFGGALYLFVRGVRPDWQETAAGAEALPCGVWFERPARSSIESLDALLAGSAAASAA